MRVLLLVVVVAKLTADPCLESCIPNCDGYGPGASCWPRYDFISPTNVSYCETACLENDNCTLAEFGYGACRLYKCLEVKVQSGYHIFRKCTNGSTDSTFLTSETLTSSTAMSPASVSQAPIPSTPATTTSADPCLESCIPNCDGYGPGGSCWPRYDFISPTNVSFCETACLENDNCTLAEFGYGACRLYKCLEVKVQSGYHIFRKCTNDSLDSTIPTSEILTSSIAMSPASVSQTPMSSTPATTTSGTSRIISRETTLFTSRTYSNWTAFLNGSTRSGLERSSDSTLASFFSSSLTDSNATTLITTIADTVDNNLSKKEFFDYPANTAAVSTVGGALLLGMSATLVYRACRAKHTTSS